MFFLATLSGTVLAILRLNDFLRGLTEGLLAAAIILGTIRLFGMFRPELTIVEAERIAVEHVNKTHPSEKYIHIDKSELKEGKWRVSGSWFPKGIMLYEHGGPKFGDFNLGVDFEFDIGSRSGRVVGYISRFKDSGKATEKT
jgi:hypothetical protein